MALDRKWQRLLALRPDIAVVPESAEPSVLRRKAPQFPFSDCQWEGWYNQKGLAVFSFGKYALRRSVSDRQFKIFMPLEVQGPHSFHLLAVWAFNGATPPRAVTNAPSIRGALAHYARFLRGSPCVVAGDFNSNSIWDQSNRTSNHALIVADLQACGLESAYHHSAGCLHGAEVDATLFQRRNISSGFHIDYCFAPKSWLGIPGRVVIGRPQQWLPLSDHMPVIVDLEPSISRTVGSAPTS
jgi:hypothetical protein